MIYTSKEPPKRKMHNSQDSQILRKFVNWSRGTYHCETWKELCNERERERERERESEREREREGRRERDRERKTALWAKGSKEKKIKTWGKKIDREKLFKKIKSESL